MIGEIHCKPALEVLCSLPAESVDMIYTDPPFGTQSDQVMSRKTKGRKISEIRYSDRYENYLEFIRPHLNEMHRVLKNTGTMYLHLDWRWVHYVKVECDSVFGIDNFLNEIVWSYNFGGRGRDRFAQKHDTILVYTKNQGQHVFNWDDIDRVPYAAPELQYIGRTKEEAEERIAKGQVPTDVWNMSIVGTNSKERLGYPNQKPRRLIERAIVASSNTGDLILDPFAGSGTTGDAAAVRGRRFIMSDSSSESIKVMRQRFSERSDVAFFE